MNFSLNENVITFPFALEPEKYQPSGYCNFSRIYCICDGEINPKCLVCKEKYQNNINIIIQTWKNRKAKLKMRENLIKSGMTDDKFIIEKIANYEYDMNIPLNFWFPNSHSHAIPIASLKFANVKIEWENASEKRAINIIIQTWKDRKAKLKMRENLIKSGMTDDKFIIEKIANFAPKVTKD